MEEGANFGLRQAAKAGQLCTAEATAYIIERLGDEEGGKVLINYYQIFNAYYSAARQSLPLPEVDQWK